MKKRFTAGTIVKYFFQGLLVLAPIAVTAFAIYWVFNAVDSLVPLEIVPVDYRIPGIGFLIVVIFVVLIGYLSSSFILGRIFDLFDRLMEKTPLIKYIYSSVKDLFDAIVGEKRKFDHPVLINIYSEDVWEIGFITQQDMAYFGLNDVMAVYVPQSYAIAGKVYLAKKHKVRPLQNMTAGEAMKFVVSGGVVGDKGESPETLAPVEENP